MHGSGAPVKMTTPEERLSALQNLVDQNNDSVTMFTGIVTSVNGRRGTIAQRGVVNENAIETVAAAVKNVNDKTLLNEGRTASDSSRIDATETGRTQMLNQLETIVSKAAADTSETHKSIKAAIDQMQMSVNTPRTLMMQRA